MIASNKASDYILLNHKRLTYITFIRMIIDCIALCLIRLCPPKTLLKFFLVFIRQLTSNSYKFLRLYHCDFTSEHISKTSL